MNARFWVVILVVVNLLIGCGSVVPQASVNTENEDAQRPEQGQNTNADGAVPDVVGPAEDADSASTLVPEVAQPVPTVDIHCTETDPHPIAQSIAETYHATYEEVMTFFCSGVGFDDIVLAYQTAELSGRDVKEVLTLWYDFGNWDDVWEELGFE
jgi:hypothetical protein